MGYLSNICEKKIIESQHNKGRGFANPLFFLGMNERKKDLCILGALRIYLYVADAETKVPHMLHNGLSLW